MTFLIDTNIISEIRKGPRCNPNVAAWYASIDDSDLYLSVVVLGEIRKGIELAGPRDPAKAEALEAWLGDVYAAFGDRILLFDRATSDEWGRMSAVRPIPMVDGLLAATAKINRMTFVTRNDKDIAGHGGEALIPETASSLTQPAA
jgi:toxin FitB